MYQITEKWLEEIETIGGKKGLNFIAEMAGDIREQLDKLQKAEKKEKMPLYGMPLFVKDNIDVAGLHTTAGSLALEDNLADEDAPIIQKLRKNGAIILGKNNMTEFANYTTQGMPAGYSSRGGQVVHAIDPSLSPSGSSSGSGVAVSVKAVPAAIGTDTSFSVIACAQENGVCGLKPPAGSLPYQGIIPIARTLDSAGVIAENFLTALQVYYAMKDEKNDIVCGDCKSLRIAVNLANLEMVSEGQLDFMNRVKEKLIALGVAFSNIDQPPTSKQRVIMKWEFKAHLEDYLKNSNASRKTLKEIVEFYEANPETMLRYGDSFLKEALFETPEGLLGQPYLEAMAEREVIKQKVKDELAPFDAVVLTGPSNIMHFCGLASVTVASGEKSDKGVPRCLILYGADEKRLYRAALAVEQVLLGEQG